MLSGSIFNAEPLKTHLHHLIGFKYIIHILLTSRQARRNQGRGSVHSIAGSSSEQILSQYWQLSLQACFEEFFCILEFKILPLFRTHYSSYFYERFLV